MWPKTPFNWYRPAAPEVDEASNNPQTTRDANHNHLVEFPPHLDNPAVLETFVDTNLIYQSGVDYEGRPIIVFYACHMPDPQRVDYDLVLSYIISKLDKYVEDGYTAVIFSGGAQYHPGWTWLYRAYNRLGRKYKKNLKRLYVVHPSVWIRFLIDMMSFVISSKFARKLVYVSNLSQLATHIPLKQIELPKPVLECNLAYESHITYPVKEPHQTRMFARPLEELMGNNGEFGYPKVVVDCVELIREQALHTIGIFRKSACSNEWKEIRRAYDQGEPVDLSTMDENTAAVLLKSFFHDLPTPLFPPSTYETLRGLTAQESTEDQIRYVRQNILDPMPPLIYKLIRYVFGLLHQVAEHSEENMMSSHNIAIVWSPSLVRGSDPHEDMQLFCSGKSSPAGMFMCLAIDHYHKVFEVSEIEVIPRTNNRFASPSDDTSSTVVDVRASYHPSTNASPGLRKVSSSLRSISSLTNQNRPKSFAA